ncbi:MAG: glycosyltransferase family 2 protein [Ignavibacteriaceae bacterium]|nr:glycosyltransferase family 2 protein [Ignavibacteriaceae bacterium]
MNHTISVVIPNYNGKHLLQTNLPSVYTSLQSSGISDFEIIIPDDASTDNSVHFIKSNYPEIILIENKTNKGFAGNTNTGIFKAQKELVLILNSDVNLTEGYFKSLLKYFDEPDTFGVTGRIIGLDSDKIQDGAKYPKYHFGNISSTTNYICKYRTSLYSLFLTGANALIDREKLIELKGYDEIFNPYYGEDVDLGLRAWRIGYKCYYEHNAICRHPNSATIKKEPPEKVKIISGRNKMYLHFIHLNGFEQIFYLIKLFIKVILKAILLDIKYLKSFRMFINSMSSCAFSRKSYSELQQAKNVCLSVRDVVALINESNKEYQIEKF